MYLPKIVQLYLDFLMSRHIINSEIEKKDSQLYNKLINT